ncbi:MAG: DUF188 domain-containing protein [Treponema sp.]|nr:DUF188 domain-containing protein [Treponema sp.]
MVKHIWVDADSCPLLVRNFTVKSAAQNNIPLTFVANKEVKCNEPFPFEMIITDKSKDSADNYILQQAQSGDLVITKDFLFADRLLQKNIIVINDRGTLFTKEIIKKHLEDRDFDMQLAGLGLVKHFHEGYGKEKFSKFRECFDKALRQAQGPHD